MKYSKRFNQDYQLYDRLKDNFNFAPYDPLKGRKPVPATPHMTVKEAFYTWDTHGKFCAIADQSTLLQLLVAKASINFHIKEFARDRALAWMSYFELLEIQQEFGLPTWFVDAVENQKLKYYGRTRFPDICHV